MIDAMTWDSLLSSPGARLRRAVNRQILQALAGGPSLPVSHEEIVEWLYPEAHATTFASRARRTQLGFLVVSAAHGDLRGHCRADGLRTRWVRAAANSNTIGCEAA